MKIRSVTAELFIVDRQTDEEKDRHEKDNNHFS